MSNEEKIIQSGQFIGWIEPYYSCQYFHTAKRPKFFAILPNRMRTEFLLPNRKQAIDWLKEAAKEL